MQSRVKMIKPKVKNIINQLFFKLKYTIIYIMVFSFNIYQLKLVLKSIKVFFFHIYPFWNTSCNICYFKTNDYQGQRKFSITRPNLRTFKKWEHFEIN